MERMSAPEELSFDKILQFMLLNGGRVTNHELVKHFKVFLTDPANRAEARETFKKHVNTLASIKNQNNEKWLILKRKYMVSSKEGALDESADHEASQDASELEAAVSPPATPVSAPPQVPAPPSSDQTPRAPPPYKPPPQFSPKILTPDRSFNNEAVFPFPTNAHVPPFSPVREGEMKENEAPQMVVVDKMKSNVHRDEISDESLKSIESKSNGSSSDMRRSVSAQDNILNTEENVHQLRRDSTPTLSEGEKSVLVKERKKIFNRNNGEGEVKTRTLTTRKSAQRIDNQKRSSVIPHLDPKGHEWIVRASAGDYDTLARMIKDNPDLVRLKDPSTYTALHWACKRGDERLVKMLATLARSTVNDRTGYTPLHIAMQFRHEKIYKLLIEVFDADPTIADWSGRKPRQYPVSVEWSPCKKAAKKQTEKDLGFLRMGSLNLRVKKTTEAFSHFLGVARTPSHAGAPHVPPRRPPPEHDHLKSWGSADNIPKDKEMPPPSHGRVKRRAATRGRGAAGDAQSRSTPTTPNQPRARLAPADHDSDSDSAAGFHASWQAKRSSAD